MNPTTTDPTAPPCLSVYRFRPDIDDNPCLAVPLAYLIGATTLISALSMTSESRSSSASKVHLTRHSCSPAGGDACTCLAWRFLFLTSGVLMVWSEVVQRDDERSDETSVGSSYFQNACRPKWLIFAEMSINPNELLRGVRRDDRVSHIIRGMAEGRMEPLYSR